MRKETSLLRAGLIGIAGLLLTAASASAQGTAPVVVRDAYLQQVSDTRVIIRFRTDAGSGGAPFVEWGIEPGVYTETTLGTTVIPPSSPTARDHEVILDGLVPSCSHHYRFGTTVDGVLGGGTAAHRFRTAAPPGEPDPFTVWVLADSGTGEAPQRAVRDSLLSHLGGDDPPELILHAGDIAYETGTDGEFTARVFGAYASLLSRSCLWPSIGNHDADSLTPAFQAGPWFEAFTLPAGGGMGGVASGNEGHYSFDHHNVHFIVIDTATGDLVPPSTMLDWVTADLQGTLADWVVALFHHPPYSKGTHDSNDGTDSGGRLVLAREYLLPLLEAGGVDLVISGHSHGYERTFLIDGAHGYGSIPDYATPDLPTLIADGRVIDAGDGDPAGAGAYEKSPGPPGVGGVCVVAGHGGRTIGGTGGHPLVVREEFEHGSCLLRFDGDLLWLENLRVDGAITDRFVISKGTRTHTLVTEVEGAGRITRSNGRPLHGDGESVILHAVPAPGWTFIEWTGDASGADPTVELVLFGDRAVTARFAPAEEDVLIVVNDLAWVPGQSTANLTRFTSPNGGSGLPSSGELVSREDGSPTGITLTVMGGSYDGGEQGTTRSGSPLPETDAALAFGLLVDAHGSIGPPAPAASGQDLVLELNGLDPARDHEIVFFGDRNDGGWTEGSVVTIEGADSFRNDSSLGSGNPDPASGGLLFLDSDDPSTRLPAENRDGWIARFVEVDPGPDGRVLLRVAALDSTPGVTSGRYANALLVVARPRPIAFLRGDVDASGDLDLGDPITLLMGLFGGGALPCEDAADFDGDAALQLSDAILLLNHLYAGGPAPPAPYPACDSEASLLGCTLGGC